MPFKRKNYIMCFPF